MNLKILDNWRDFTEDATMFKATENFKKNNILNKCKKSNLDIIQNNGLYTSRS